MLVGILGSLWWLLKLPVRLVMLPFEVLSAVVSLVLYLIVFGAIAILAVLFLL